MTLALEVFKKMSQEEIKEYGKSIPNGYTRDKNGNELTCKTSTGCWYEYTRDKNGNVLTYKNLYGHWYEYSRDKNGKELTFKNSDGVDIKYFLWGKKYNLGYDKNTKKYLAGCQTLSYKLCEEFYEENKDAHEDSHNFIRAIREHQNALTSS